MHTVRSLTAGWLLGAGAALLLAAALPPGAAAQSPLPEFGDPSASTLSSSDERALGEAFMREIRATVKIIDDPEVEAYIQSLGHRISAAARDGARHFEFFVVAANDINAFAGPGGYIGVNTGLILASESESELAAVLAHEIAHVTQRHIARAIASADRSNIPALAGLLAAVVIGSQNAQAGQATAAAVVGLQVQHQIDFTRANEVEADHVGMQFLQTAGFDPNAMPAFFEKLQNSARYYRQPPEFLSTHPVTSSRIADSRARAEQFAYRQYSDSLGYSMVRARLRVLTATDAAEQERYFAARLDTTRGQRRLAVRYGHALALDRGGRHGEAIAELPRLDKEVPDRIAVRLALAAVERRGGSRAHAERILTDLYQLYPDNSAVLRGYAGILIEGGQADQAVRALERYRQIRTFDAALYKLLAQAFERSGRSGESRLALAEHFYLAGRLDEAMNQLEIARREGGASYYVGARVDARLEALRREQALRARR